MQAIETVNLTKVYRSRLGTRHWLAVDGLNLAVPAGEVFGFLGPNGAGKTTTIMMLLGNIYPTEGTANLLEHPIGNLEARRRIGFLPEKFQFHEFLSAQELLELHGRLYRMPRSKVLKRIPDVLEMVGLIERRHSKIQEFSKGMQQRIGLAQAILNDPDLIILDEPTSALDPIGRRDVRDLINRMKAAGKTIFLNSHLLSEIEMTCDRVAILKGGRLVRQGSIQDLLSAPSTVEMRILNLNPAILKEMERLACQVSANEESVTASVENETAIAALVEAVVRQGGQLVSLIPKRESLEDMFIRVVKGEEAA
ncbi:MAG: ABC transporter ATP-binding protein [Armatimonadetes bacterium]|nr:ABC transporter ATP-binding protein [Armatimonadota bacterium]